MVYINEPLGTMAEGDADGMLQSDVLKANASVDYPRKLLGIALTGGSAVMDSKIELFSGKNLLASINNMLTTHTPSLDELIMLNRDYFLQEDLGTLALNDIDGMDKTANLKTITKWKADRQLTRVCLSGGSAEGDSAIELLAGNISLGTVYNQMGS